MGKAGNSQIVKAMTSYGALFKVTDVDSVGARILATAATAGVGFSSADATYEDCTALMQRGMEALAATDVQQSMEDELSKLLKQQQ